MSEIMFPCIASVDESMRLSTHPKSKPCFLAQHATGLTPQTTHTNNPILHKYPFSGAKGNPWMGPTAASIDAKRVKLAWPAAGDV